VAWVRGCTRPILGKGDIDVNGNEVRLNDMNIMFLGLRGSAVFIRTLRYRTNARFDSAVLAHRSDFVAVQQRAPRDCRCGPTAGLATWNRSDLPMAIRVGRSRLCGFALDL